MQDQLRKSAIKCIVVSSDKNARKTEESNLSIIPAKKETLWDKMTSAIECPLIEFLNKELKSTSLPRSKLKDFETVLRRLQRCSSYTKIRNTQKIHRIPNAMKIVLKK